MVFAARSTTYKPGVAGSKPAPPTNRINQLATRFITTGRGFRFTEEDISMKWLAAVCLIAVIAIGLSSFASAEDPEAKSCTATSTSGKCLLREIAALKGQITTLQGQVTTLQGQLAGTSTSTLGTD